MMTATQEKALPPAHDPKILSEELARARKELERFASIASHDLQEPLFTAAGYLELIQARHKGKLDKEVEEFMENALEGIRRMRDLLQGLSAYSRTTSRAAPFQHTAVDAAFQQALQNLEVMIRSTNAHITKDPFPEVSCDANQMMQVFQHLLTNAIQFRGKNDPIIHVGCVKTAREWIFCVKDNGIGFEPRYADEIFAPFRRLQEKKECPGSGMGLAVCKKIIERHGGRMWAASEPGSGATVFFTLPVAG